MPEMLRCRSFINCHLGWSDAPRTNRELRDQVTNYQRRRGTTKDRTGNFNFPAMNLKERISPTFLSGCVVEHLTVPGRKVQRTAVPIINRGVSQQLTGGIINWYKLCKMHDGFTSKRFRLEFNGLTTQTRTPSIFFSLSYILCFWGGTKGSIQTMTGYKTI